MHMHDVWPRITQAAGQSLKCAVAPYHLPREQRLLVRWPTFDVLAETFEALNRMPAPAQSRTLVVYDDVLSAGRDSVPVVDLQDLHATPAIDTVELRLKRPGRPARAT